MNLSADKSSTLRIVDYIFLPLAITTSLLRCYTRLFIVRAFGVDDGLMMVATAFYIMYVVSGLISVAHGGGRHQDTLSEYDASVALKHWFLCYLWYDSTMCFSRLSIGIFFLRLTVKRIQIYLIYLVMISTVFFGFIFMGFAIGECTPPAYFWDKGIVNGYCMDTKIIVILMFLYSTSSLLSDATFAVFPMFLMRGLQMDKRTKYALIPILGLGWIASIAVLIRFAFLTSLGSQDITYDALTIAILSSIEQGLAITAGNLATLRPLFKRRFWLWGSYVAENSGDNGHHPPTIGAQDRAKGRIGTDASVGLDTFTFEGLHDEETGIPTSEHNGSVLKSQGIAVTTDIAVINQRRNNLWRSSRREDNESQEELNSKPSNEALDSSTQIVPASFLTNEGRLRDSAEAYNS